ncbi:PTS sugar transporter subunit IIC [Streptococcus catagoni]|uniref:PTS sugar transporter subunit IIC n=1 Tax=Streptococcus catagoni TaxID=2654874 RepID=UPI001409B2D2|nr:PTS sugar transporter subunit IIC [Streptococcus catagoni]
MIIFKKGKFKEMPVILRNSLRQLMPLSLIYAWLQIMDSVFLAPDSFFVETSHLVIYSESWMFFASQMVQVFSKIVMTIIASYFVFLILMSYQELQKRPPSFLPTFGFLLTWILFGESGFNNHFVHQPYWFLLALLAFSILFFEKRIKFKSSLSPAIIVTVLVCLSAHLAHYLSMDSDLSPNSLLQDYLSSLIGDGPRSLLQVILWSGLAIFLQDFGLFVPDILQKPSKELLVYSENLNATLSKQVEHLPHLFSFYTLRDSFAMFGGIGILLALVLAVLIESRRGHNNDNQRMGFLCLAPILFDQNLPFLVGFPIILQPLFIFPMLVTTALAEIFGAILLALGWLSPAVYSVPKGTPSLFFGFLASNGDWRYLFVILIIISFSVVIYLPFVKRALKQGGCHEENL